MTKVIQSFQSSDLQPLKASLLRGDLTPGRPYPLIITLSTGIGEHSFAKIRFTHNVLVTFAQKLLFSAAPRDAAVWALGGQGVHPKVQEKTT